MESSVKVKHTLIGKLFVIWLYIFLCFSYTVGTDWRSYENLYNYSYDKELLHKGYEQGFYFLIYLSRHVIPDFWLFLGLIKCLYLFSVLKFIRRFTDSIFLAMAMMLNYNLLFMLIDNPLRFMVGSIILLWSTGYLIDKKYMKYGLVSLLSLLFHISLIVPIVLSLLIVFKDKVVNRSKTTLTIWYLIACVIGFFPALLNLIANYWAEKIPMIASKLLTVYVAESTDAMFTLGSLIMFILFFVLLHNRQVILKSKYGPVIFFFGLCYMYLYRILLILPTGFRFTLYFGLFFVLCLTVIIKSSSLKVRFALYLLVGLTIVKTLWTSYQYLPYTNSSYYILTSNHLPKSYRDNLNKKAYNKRTGKVVRDKNGAPN